MRVLLFILFISSTSFMWAQSNLDKIKELEMKAVTKLNEARQFKTIKDQHPYIQEFEEILREMMTYDETFTHNFDTLARLISTIKSPDGTFRIFNWNMEYGEYKEHKYYCLIMKKDPKSGDFVIIELFDHSEDYYYEAEFKALTDKKWYGCLYYEIVPIEKGFKTQYTLLGWDGKNNMSNQKIIETMKFHKKDAVKFGEAMFKSDDDKTKRRVIFEYTEDAVMSLKHSKTKKEEMIVFDHLSPISPAVDIPSWYAPDLSFDAYILQNGKWVYVKDVDARTGKKFNSKYNTPNG